MYELINPRSQGSSRQEPCLAELPQKRRNRAQRQLSFLVRFSCLDRRSLIKLQLHFSPFIAKVWDHRAGEKTNCLNPTPGANPRLQQTPRGADAPFTSDIFSFRSKIWAALGQPGNCCHLTAELLRVHRVLLTRSGFNSTHLSERSLECEIEGVLFLIFFFPSPHPFDFLKGPEHHQNS